MRRAWQYTCRMAAIFLWLLVLPGALLCFELGDWWYEMRRSWGAD